MGSWPSVLSYHCPPRCSCSRLTLRFTTSPSACTSSSSPYNCSISARPPANSRPRSDALQLWPHRVLLVIVCCDVNRHVVGCPWQRYHLYYRHSRAGRKAFLCTGQAGGGRYPASPSIVASERHLTLVNISGNLPRLPPRGVQWRGESERLQETQDQGAAGPSHDREVGFSPRGTTNQEVET